MMEIYLLCGVPGSGKSWVCDQLKDKFHYLSHDFYDDALIRVTGKLLQTATKPILIDCPFNERTLRSRLEKTLKATVIPVFIVESPQVIKERYFKRDGRVPGQNVLTRAETIKNKVREWSAFHGTSEEVLKHLRHIGGA